MLRLWRALRSWIWVANSSFAGAGLAEQQDSRIGGRDPVDVFEDPRHRRTPADDDRAELLPAVAPDVDVPEPAVHDQVHSA
jgi:hypothetical protein